MKRFVVLGSPSADFIRKRPGGRLLGWWLSLAVILIAGRVRAEDSASSASDGGTVSGKPSSVQAGQTSSGKAAADSKGGLVPAERLSRGPVAPDAQREKILGPGDEIRIYMQEDPDVKYAGLISASGTVPVPFLGEFRIAGYTCAQAARALSEALCESLYQKATISVILVATAPGKVYVYGAVKKPGTVTLPESGKMTVLQLISAVDGLTSWAAPEDAYILRRPGNKPGVKPVRIPVDLRKVLSADSPEADVALQPNDVVFVPGVNGNTAQVMTSDVCEIIVVGEVNNPGIVVFAPGEQRTLMRAIFKAGGFTRFAKDKSVRLIRYEKGGKRKEMKVNAYDIIERGYLDKDVPLEPGDMLIVPQKLINF